jgi:hypothetical protein
MKFELEAISGGTRLTLWTSIVRRAIDIREGEDLDE